MKFVRFIAVAMLMLMTQLSIAQDDNAMYTVTFTGNWTTQSVPSGVVSSAHFTTLAIATHNSSVSFWAPGATATSQFELLAELGSTSALIGLMNSSSHTDQVLTQACCGPTGVASFNLSVSKDHPLLTFATMIGPSPDWFVGLSSYSLLDSTSDFITEETIDLFAYDAGTEDGNGFSLNNPATSPQGVITSLRNVSPFSNVRMASVRIVRTDTPMTVVPTIVSVERASSMSQHTNADSVTWVVTFNTAVANVSANDFVVQGSTATVTSVSARTGDNTVYNVVASGGDLANLNGAITLGLSSSHDIESSDGTALTGTTPSNAKNFIIDNQAPTVTSVTPTSVDSSPFAITITFSEDLASGTFNSASDITSSSASITAPVKSGSAYTASVTPTDATTAATITIVIVAGVATDLAGNDSESHSVDISFSPSLPSFGSQTVSDVSVRKGLAIDPIELPKATGGVSPLSYSLTPELPDGLSFNESTQSITGTPTEETSDTTYTWTVTDANSNSVSLTFSIEIFSLPDLQFSDLPDSSSFTLALGEEIDPIDLPEAEGGRGELTYALSSTLPAGLVLGERVIVGSPTVLVDSAQFTWVATDADGFSVEWEFTLTVMEVKEFAFLPGTEVSDKSFLQNDAISSFTLPSAVGGEGEVSYALSPALPEGLVLDDATSVVSGTPLQPFTETEFTWTATDQDGDTVSLSFSITVLEDLQPSFAMDASIANQLWRIEVMISPIALPMASGGNGELSHSITPDLPAGLVLDTDSYTISGTPTEMQESLTYTWQVSDEDGDTDSLSFEIRIIDIDALMLDRDLDGKSFTVIQNSAIEPFKLPEATGGFGELSYALDPELPEGLTLGEDGFMVSGTPNSALTTTVFTWTVTGQFDQSDSISFMLTVVEDLHPMFDESAQIKDITGIQNSGIYPVQLPVASGGNDTLTYSLEPDLPAGLMLNASTNQILGTPTTAVMKSSFTWRVTDIDGDTAELVFSIYVAEDMMPSFGSASVDVLMVVMDSAIDPVVLPEATGGNGELTYSLSPSVSGLMFDSKTRTLSGTPDEAGETELTLTATDKDGDTVSLVFTLAVEADLMPSFGDASISDIEVIQNSPFDPVTLPEATGGNGELTYSLSPTAVAGVMFDDMTRTLQGSPTSHGMTMYTWQVSDIDGDSAKLSFMLNVVEDLMPSFADDAAIENQSYIQYSEIEALTLPAAMGGNTQLTYSLTPALPDGLMLEEHVISGTPTKPLAMAKYTWEATDIDGDMVSLDFTISIAEDLQPQFDVADLDLDRVTTQNSAIDNVTLPLAASGNGDLSYALSPMVPAGLSFNADTRTISGTPSQTQDETTYTWTATDIDGDMASIEFSITVIEDLMPAFATGETIADQEYIEDFAIEGITLPSAMAGNGASVYSLTPDLPAGLQLDLMTHEISGTPTEAMSSTVFAWQVQDEDGDMDSIEFSIVVHADTQPEFSQSVADMTLFIGEAIAPISLPAASGGNGDLNYAFSGNLPEGLMFNEESATISGTPVTEQPSTSYEWSVMDVDGDSASISFSLTVQPQVPTVVGNINPLALLAGGTGTMVDAGTAIEGTVTSWQVASSNTSIVSVSSISQGRFTATPHSEGRSMITVTAGNVSGSVSVTIAVTVSTSSIEQSQLDVALNQQAKALLSSALNVFKRRTDIYTGGTNVSLTNSLLPTSWMSTSSQNFGDVHTPLYDFDDNSQLSRPLGKKVSPFNGPIHLNHSGSGWSVWGALDIESFSVEQDNAEVDGGLSSQYLGADFLLNENLYAGVAVGNHSADSSYIFVDDTARGSGELDTSLTAFYPYLNLSNEESLSLYLVGGFGSGESTLTRSHVVSDKETADASANIFAAGLEYVVWSGNSVHMSLVGDVGSANLSTEADAGLLADRETSSSRVSVGGGLTVAPQMQSGTMSATLDARFVNAGGDGATGSGIEIGGTLNFTGSNLDFMADARLLNQSADDDVDVSQNSFTARLRYKANSDASGLYVSIEPRLQNGMWSQGRLDLDSLQFGGIDSMNLNGMSKSVKGEVGYGISMPARSMLITPQFSWTSVDTTHSRRTLGATFDFTRRNQSLGGLRLGLIETLPESGNDSMGAVFDFELRL